MKILRRNLSLMLAVRYLNPLRSMFSIITLICLGGVALGVMVLIVVLSVMEGLQKEIEDKALAFAPHYVVSLVAPNGTNYQRVDMADSAYDWRGLVERIRKEADVETAYPLLEGDAFAQSDLGRMAIHFSALQPGNTSQLAPIQEMIKEGTADFGEGLDEECVVSFETAKRLGLNLGDSIHVTPVGNLDEVADIYSMIQKPMLTHADEKFMEAVATLFDGVPEDAAEAVAPEEKVALIITALQGFPAKGLREGEITACRRLYAILMEHLAGEPFTVVQRAEWKDAAAALASLDRDREDGRAVKGISQMTMPIDLRIVGIYQAPENIGGPNVYMPLPIAQNVMGLAEDGEESVMGVCVRVKDIHVESDIAERIYALLPPANPVIKPAAPTEEGGDDAPPPLEDVELVEGVAEVAEAPVEATVEAVPADPVAEQAAKAAATAEAVEGAPAPEEIEEAVSGGPFMWAITPWTESFKKWSELIANERTMMSFVLSIISLIASFCIMAVMFTMSIQRKREIAVLQALGATPAKIMGIFAWQGVMIGLLGSLLGVGLALLVLYYRLELQAALASIGMDPFPMQGHGITLPANYDPVTFTQQALTAFIMVVVAAIIPAFIVSRQDPSKALRSN